MMIDSQANPFEGHMDMVTVKRASLSLLVLTLLTLFAVFSGPVVAQETDADKARVSDQPDGERSAAQPRQLFYPGQPRRTPASRLLMGAPRVITPVPLAIPGTIRPPRDDRRDHTPRFGDVDISAEPTGTSPQADGASVEARIFETETLGLLDPSIQPAGMQSEFQTSLNLWQGASHTEAANILATIKGGIQSPALRDLAGAMLRGRLDLTPFQGDDEVYTLLEARFNGLRALSDREGYSSLAAQFPVEWDVTRVAKDIAKAYILAGNHSRACTIASDQQGSSGDGFWLKLATLCSAVSADRTTISFQIGILQDLGAATPSFILMVDHILNEAESGVPADPIELEGPIALTFLDAWAWQLSNAKLSSEEPTQLAAVSDPTDTTDGNTNPGDTGSDTGEEAPAHRLIIDDVDPFALQIFLSETGLDAGSRLKLAALAKQAGLPFHDYYIEPVRDDAAVSQTLIESWNQAIEAGSVMSIVDTVNRFAANSEKTAQSAAYAGPYIRAALLDDNMTIASSWWSWLRASSKGSSLTVDSALIDSWPVMLLGQPDTASEANAVAFETWWATRVDDPTRFEQVSLLLGLLSGLGMEADPSLWSLAESGPLDGVTGRAVNPATWRAMMMASQAGDLIGVLSLSIKLLGETPVRDMSPAVTIATVSALHNAGFGAAAQQLALEAWIYRGF